MENRKKILMAFLSIALFVVVAMLVYMIRNQAIKDTQVFPVPQENQQKAEGEPVDQAILDSLSAPAGSEEGSMENVEENRKILETLSVPQDGNATNDPVDEEVLKSLEAPVK